MQFLPAAVQAVGSIWEGESAYAEARAGATVAEQNARLARLQAGVKEDLIRKQTRMKLGEQRASAAQSGFDPNTGSLLELQAESAGNLELDALSTRYEGALQALSFETQAGNMRRQGRAARVGGYLNAAGSLLGAAGKTYGGTQIPRQPPAPVETRNPWG